MNLTISKAELYEALQKVVGVVPQKTTISILTCILMEVKEDQLRLTGTDLEISITHSLPVKSEIEGEAAVPAKLFLEIVRELPDVPLTLFSDDDTKLILRTEMGEYKIATQPREDFPNITVEESDLSFSIKSDILTRMTHKTIFAVSADELRPALTGINVESLDGNLLFVATDGHRLAKIVFTDFQLSDNSQPFKMIIPTKALHLLIRNLEGSADLDVQISEDHVVFQLKDTIIYSKLISGSYPNYERVLPKDNDKTFRINRDLLISTLRRVSIFSSSLTNQVRLVLSPREVTIHSQDIEFGAEAKETIPATFSDDWLQIGYNSAYLMDILRHIDTDEVIFTLKDSGSAAIITPPEQSKNEELTMLLMPIRISEEERSAE